MSALRSAGFPACGFWGHSCPHFQELRPHPLLITPLVPGVREESLTFLLNAPHFAALVRSGAVATLSGHEHNYDDVRGEGFFGQTRRERRAYPSGVCEERATKSGRKRTAARRVAPNLACGGVARQIGRASCRGRG